jgi:hypothetical protein
MRIRSEHHQVLWEKGYGDGRTRLRRRSRMTMTSTQHRSRRRISSRAPSSRLRKKSGGPQLTISRFQRALGTGVGQALSPGAGTPGGIYARRLPLDAARSMCDVTRCRSPGTAQAVRGLWHFRRDGSGRYDLCGERSATPPLRATAMSKPSGSEARGRLSPQRFAASSPRYP